MKRIVLFLIITLFSINLFGCKTTLKELDYISEAQFESDLNSGKNLEGKTVLIKCGEFHPQSAYGYNIWAGEHLNFISKRNPDVSVGDEIVVKATSITSSMKSWLIEYEKLNKNEYNLTNSNTNTSNSGKTSETKTKTETKTKNTSTVGNWKVDEFVDDFKMPTGEKYISNISKFKGSFSNSAASNEKLYAKIIFEQKIPCIMLYTYYDNGSPEKAYNNEKYNVKIRDSAGNVHTGEGLMMEDSDRVIIYTEALINKLVEILCNSEDCHIYLEESERPSTNYTFKVEASNFKEKWEELLVND